MLRPAARSAPCPAPASPPTRPPARPPTLLPPHLYPLARAVARVGGHKGGEGEAGQRVLPKLLQQVAGLLQGFELQGVEGVEDLGGRGGVRCGHHSGGGALPAAGTAPASARPLLARVPSKTRRTACECPRARAGTAGVEGTEDGRQKWQGSRVVGACTLLPSATPVASVAVAAAAAAAGPCRVARQGAGPTNPVYLFGQVSNEAFVVAPHLHLPALEKKNPGGGGGGGGGAENSGGRAGRRGRAARACILLPLFH